MPHHESPENPHPKTFDMNGYRQSMAAIIGTGSDTRIFWDALDFADEAHKGQTRKSGEPYIMHPCAVALILAELLDIRSPEVLAAALLHDTVEDVDGVDGPLLREKFGPNVEAIVDGCTKVTHSTGTRQTHRKIFSGAAAKLEVILVKLADRLHNMRTLQSMKPKKRQRIADETLDIYAPLATILGLFDIKRELYNLAITYKFPQQIKPIKRRIAELQTDPVALDIVERIRKELKTRGLPSQVELRTRDLWAYYDVHHHVLMRQIESPQTIIILPETREDCYAVLGVVNRLYPPTPRTIRDFIANPKPTGYQCLHARPNIKGSKYLFKIRTEEMQRRARRGMVRDWALGSEASINFFKQIQNMFDVMGNESMSYRDLIVSSGRKEIYTYTPKGDQYCLPADSTVLDFAFSVSPEIGRTCVGAKIGQLQVLPTHRLQDGNVVRILRQSKPVVFDAEVVSLCKTHQACSALGKTIRLRQEEVSRQIGISILQQELQRYGIPREVLDKPGMKEVLKHFNLKDMSALYLAVGQNQLKLSTVVPDIRDRVYSDRPTDEPPTGIFNQVNLSMLDPVAIKISSCCHPTPLDKGIIALLSKRGLSLHQKDCSKLAQLNLQREDVVEVRWDLPRTPVTKTQKIIFMKSTRSRLMDLLAAAPEEMQLTGLNPLGVHNSNASGDWEVDFQVNNLFELKKVIHHVERSDLNYEFVLEM